MNVQFIVFSSYLQLNEITSYIRFSWSSQQIFISKLLYINLRMMKQNCKINPQYAYKVIAYPDVSTLPSETKFVYIVNLYTKKAYVEIFDNEEIKIKEILKRFLDKTKYKVPDAVAYILTLKTGLKIDHEMSIGSLKNILLRDSMQGFQFKIQHLYKVEKEKQYDDQCSVLDYYRKEYGSRIIICVKVIIILKQNPNASELMLFKINRNDDEETTLKNLLAQLSNTYQNMDKLSKDEIVITKIKVQKISGTKTRQKSDKNFSFLRGRVFFDNYQLQVLIARKNLKQLKRRLVKRYNSVLCIYKEGEKQPQKFKYDEIADLTVQQLYFNHLQLQESQKKKQAIYCLKISDLILNPEDKICKAQVYFAQQKAGVTKNVVAKVVNQKMIFYYVIPKISQRIQDQFTLQSIKIPEHQDNARKQFSRILEARSQKASNDYFKKKKNLEPIVIYSSELIYYQQETKQDKVIYQALNKSLREAKTFSLDFQEYKSNWKLVYASTLLKHLDKISDFKGETWRGISFDPNYKKQHIGYIFTFKQFLSTSLNQHTAVNFAIKYDSIQPYHMYHFKVLSGKNIIDYSFYEEGEILIQPFTQFQLVRIRVQKINGKKFIVYDMQERETQKKIPEIINNFIIWIDINPKDGKQIFDSISETYDSTIFIQLKSTEQFEAWTIRHNVIFNNPDAKIIFITNMTRKEGDSYNEYAGIESLALARNRKKNIHAYFYIGDIDACYKKLTNKNVSLNYLKVTNNPNQMKEFLQDQLMQ